MNDRDSPFVPRDGIYPEETGGRVQGVGPKRLPQKVEQIPKKRIFGSPPVGDARFPEAMQEQHPEAYRGVVGEAPVAKAPVAKVPVAKVPVFKTKRPGSTQPPVNQRFPVETPSPRPPREEYPRKTSFWWVKRPYDYKRALEQLENRGYQEPKQHRDAGVSLLGILNRQIHKNFVGSVQEKSAALSAFIRNYKLSMQQQPGPGYRLGPDGSTWINPETQEVHIPSEDQIYQAWKAAEEELFGLRASGEFGQGDSHMLPENKITLQDQVKLNALEKKFEEMERLPPSRGVSYEKSKLYTEILDLKEKMGQ